MRGHKIFDDLRPHAGGAKYLTRPSRTESLLRHSCFVAVVLAPRATGGIRAPAVVLALPKPSARVVFGGQRPHSTYPPAHPSLLPAKHEPHCVPFSSDSEILHAR